MQTLPWKVKDLKACLFDFGGTLDSDGITWQDSFFQLYWKHGLQPDRETFRKAFYQADDTLTETHCLLGTGLRATIELQVSKVLAALGFKDCEGQKHAIAEDFIASTKSNIARNRPLLAALQKRFALGIVSNFYGNLEIICDELDIRDYFLCIVDSNRQGTTKPEPQIFQAALDQIGAKPYQALFVGDNVFRDMEGAKKMGMPHVWLSGEFERARRPCCPEDPVIHSLEELGPLLLNGQRHK